MENAKRIHQLLNRLYSISDELSQECDGSLHSVCYLRGHHWAVPCRGCFWPYTHARQQQRLQCQTDLGEPVQIRTSGKGTYVPIYGGEGLLLVVKIRKTTLELIYGGPPECLECGPSTQSPRHPLHQYFNAEEASHRTSCSTPDGEGEVTILSNTALNSHSR